ncbi:hypothetical protein [Brevibacillus agri]|nr:hypothetical protein [Brevibacillus agri]MDR9507421.1 hypothetical protein [Brevibacillus agri]
MEGIIIANGLMIGPYNGSQLAQLAVGLDSVIDVEKYEVVGAIGE